MFNHVDKLKITHGVAGMKQQISWVETFVWLLAMVSYRDGAVPFQLFGAYL